MASRFGERFFVKARLEKRRNTVCISSFSNHRIDGKDPAKREDAIVRCCLKITEKKKEIILSIVCSMSVVALAAEPNSYVKLSLTDAEIQERIERALQIKSLYEQLRKKLLERRQLH